jgi:predicted ribosomally synthesized peptide with nif11-like leader
MSVESAKAFYERVATDEAFKEQLRDAASDDERRAMIRTAGYDFTPEEWEVVIDQLREINDRELSEVELETVAGGVLPFPVGMPVGVYGPVFPPELPWPFDS